MKGDRRSAFTLVEIMIVVAIIGILIAIAVPGFIKARNSSRLKACQENLTKIDGAIQQYILEYEFADLNDAANAGGLYTYGWETIICGPDNYLRAVPTCPSGGANGGRYLVGTVPGPAGESAYCENNAAPLRHVYPMD